MDEPTSGLDVESARIIRQLIREFNEQGKTILLTTHNIDEASRLCDRTAIMNHGRIVAVDRPENLKQTIQSTASIEVAFEKGVDREDLNFKDVSDFKKEGDKFKLYTDQTDKIIHKLADYADKSNNKIISLNTLGPSLEDVFVKLTKEKE